VLGALETSENSLRKVLNKHAKEQQMQQNGLGLQKDPFSNLQSYSTSVILKEKVSLNENTHLSDLNENQRSIKNQIDESVLENSFLLTEESTKMQNQQETFEQWLCSSTNSIIIKS